MLRYVGSRKIPPGKTLTRKTPTHQTQHIARGPVSHLILPFINNKITNRNFSIPLIIHRLSFTRNKSVLKLGIRLDKWSLQKTLSTWSRDIIPKRFLVVIVHCWLVLFGEFSLLWFFHRHLLFPFFCLWLLDFDSKLYLISLYLGLLLITHLELCESSLKSLLRKDI